MMHKCVMHIFHVLFAVLNMAVSCSHVNLKICTTLKVLKLPSGVLDYIGRNLVKQKTFLKGSFCILLLILNIPQVLGCTCCQTVICKYPKIILVHLVLCGNLAFSLDLIAVLQMS